MKIRVADYVAEFVYKQGVKDVFMLSGGGIMHLVDGLACNDNLNIVCLHHEQSVSMAVESYSKKTGNLGVGYFTCGPGATNAITGLAGAWLDSISCLFISGQVKRKDSIIKSGVSGIRQIGVQEINILPVIESLTKYSAFVDDPNDIREHLEKAVFYAKEGRPGPVWLDIPLDVQAAYIETETLKGFVSFEQQERVSNSELHLVANYIKSASRPVIMAGQGVRISQAIEDVISFAEKYNIPIVTTYLGIDVVNSEHPRYVGRIGIKGDRAGNFAMQNSDLLIVIGSSLPVSEVGYEYDQFARGATIVVVDVDETSHKKQSIKIDCFIKEDAKYFIKGLAHCLEKERFVVNDECWIKRCISWRQKYPVCLPEYSNIIDKINSYYFVDRLSRKLDEGDVVVTDAGSAFYAGAQAVCINKGVRYITSGGLATMGYSLPASIGASVASNRYRIMCITGDGSFQQNLQEIQSIIFYNLPIKIFVLNNEGYLSIRTVQTKFFNKRLLGEGKKSGVSFPSNEKIAIAYGIKFIRMCNNGDLNQKLDEVLNYDGPVLCEVMTPDDQVMIPTMASKKTKTGQMVSKPLEDMFPFLSREEFKDNMDFS
jgi:acetolactate synthase I/II/III large subunit